MNKKGSAMVEAALVFPVMILAVLSVIAVITMFYQQLEQQAGLHMYMRAESGSICENMEYSNVPDIKMPVYRKPQQIYSYGITAYDAKWLLGSRKKETEARKYLIDETDLIRMTDLLKE